MCWGGEGGGGLGEVWQDVCVSVCICVFVYLLAQLLCSGARNRHPHEGEASQVAQVQVKGEGTQRLRRKR